MVPSASTNFWEHSARILLMVLDKIVKMFLETKWFLIGKSTSFVSTSLDFASTCTWRHNVKYFKIEVLQRTNSKVLFITF